MTLNGLEITYLTNGKGIDPIQMLYADLPTQPELQNSQDPKDILFRINKQGKQSSY